MEGMQYYIDSSHPYKILSYQSERPYTLKTEADSMNHPPKTTHNPTIMINT
jgi:hypothetical protein